MKKEKIVIEQRLNSKSPNIIWNLIGTPEGMGKWLADEIEQENARLTFTWGKVWSNHEIRHARMERNTLTGDFTLHITDFAEEEDVDALQSIWAENMKRLHHTSGL